MAQHPNPARSAAGRAWLPAAAEVEAYEGLRLGEEAAFRRVAEPLQPVLLRLARLAGGAPGEAERRAVRAWALALGGLDMFRWQTPFASWVAGITIDLGRSSGIGQPPGSRPRPGDRPPPPEPDDWSDLPWSPRWVGAREVLRSALWQLPLAQREVVHAHDLERWPWGRVCDVLGLTQVSARAMLAEGRLGLRNALAPLVGLPIADRAAATETSGLVDLLPAFLEEHPPKLDPRLLVVFERWDRARRRRLSPWSRLRRVG